MIWVDHLLAATLVFVDPPLGRWAISRWIRRIASGDAGARRRMYRTTIAALWAWTIGLLALWAWLDRPFESIGLTTPSGREAWITVALCGVALAFFATQIRAVFTSAEARAGLLAQLDRAGPGVQAVIPATAPEFRMFVPFAATAGICEEVLSRGFLLWYFTAWLPWWAAIAVTVVAFGAGHAYQGLRGVLVTAAAGGIYLAAYLLTGSLIAPIVIHAATDLANGLIAYRAQQPAA